MQLRRSAPVWGDGTGNETPHCQNRQLTVTAEDSQVHHDGADDQRFDSLYIKIDDGVLGTVACISHNQRLIA